jgi:hypothetical protein
MTKLTKALAIKLFQLYGGDRLPASKVDHPLILELISEGIILDQRSGRTKSVLFVTSAQGLADFLKNRFSIADLGAYIETLKQNNLSRAMLARQAADSKLVKVRTFKGFLVNTYQPVEARLNGQELIIHPAEGTFQFIHGFEDFIPAPNVTIVNMENSENFSQIAKLRYLFQDLTPLFVTRYPQNQSKDMIRWLTSIPNAFLHFGDYDFAGINIYIQEYKRHLGDRATFFVPPDFEEMLRKHGSKKIYDGQNLSSVSALVDEPAIVKTISLLNNYKKGLEQETLIRF